MLDISFCFLINYLILQKINNKYIITSSVSSFFGFNKYNMTSDISKMDNRLNNMFKFTDKFFQI